MDDRPTNPFVDKEAVGEGENCDEEIEGASSGFEFPAPTHDIDMADVSQDEDLDVSSLALQNALHGEQHVLTTKEEMSSRYTCLKRRIKQGPLR
jgi:hypothetical protein